MQRELAKLAPQRLCWCVLAATAMLLPGCGWDGHFSIFGYSTKPNYDTSIKTVYVPIFRNDTLLKGLEFDLTRYIVRQIESRTPYKVSSSPLTADTELSGKIVSVFKSVINGNQVGEVRQAQVIVTVQVMWRDHRPGRTGEFLSAPPKKEDDTTLPRPIAPPPEIGPMPGVLPIPGRPVGIIPTTGPGVMLVQGMGQFEVELGGSLAQALADACNRIAVRITEMMEVWPAPGPAPVPLP